MCRTAMAAAVLLALALGGCDIFTALGGGAGLPCDDDQACNHGMLCIDRTCQRPAAVVQPIESGPRDTPRAESGADGARPDVPALDAAAPDTPQRDAVRTDQGGSDTSFSDLRHDDLAAADLQTGADLAGGDRSAMDSTLAGDHRAPDSGAADAGGCWYGDFGRRWPLTIAPAIERLDEFPMLLQLDCQLRDCSSFGFDGANLRVTDASCQLLPHEIENWDGSGVSAVWFKVPTIEAAAPGALVYLYGSYTGASRPAARPTSEVWSDGFQGVYHLGGDASDSSPLDNDGTPHGGAQASGQVGKAVSFDGSGWIGLRDDQPLLRSVGGATLSGWVRLDAAGAGTRRNLIAIAIGNPTPTSLSRAVLTFDDSFVPGAIVRRLDADQPLNVFLGSPLPSGSFHLVAVRITYNTALLEVFVDGSRTGVTSMASVLTSGITSDTNSRNATLAADDTGVASFFQGVADELRIENVARSGAWIEMSYRSQRPDSSVVQIGPVEMR